MAQCTAKDLIGTHVGDTEDNVKKKLNEARGGVLLIDEARNETVMLAVACCQVTLSLQAYTLCGGLYGKDAQVLQSNRMSRDAPQQTYM